MKNGSCLCQWGGSSGPDSELITDNFKDWYENLSAWGNRMFVGMDDWIYNIEDVNTPIARVDDIKYVSGDGYIINNNNELINVYDNEIVATNVRSYDYGKYVDMEGNLYAVNYSDYELARGVKRFDNWSYTTMDGEVYIALGPVPVGPVAN